MEIRNGACFNYSGLDLAVVQNDASVIQNFAAPEGNDFILMLLGISPKGQPANIDMLLSNLGLISSNGVAQEIMRLNGVIADLEAKLAAKG